MPISGQPQSRGDLHHGDADDTQHIAIDEGTATGANGQQTVKAVEGYIFNRNGI